MISNLDQHNVVHLLFKIFLILSSGGHLGWQSGIIWAIDRSLRITAAEVVDFLCVHRYKIFIFFLISNIFTNNGYFAIQIFPIRNI